MTLFTLFEKKIRFVTPAQQSKSHFILKFNLKHQRENKREQFFFEKKFPFSIKKNLAIIKFSHPILFEVIFHFFFFSLEKKIIKLKIKI